jgi:hypothetical protein
MPHTFPTLDPDTGALVDVEYFSIREVAERLHMSRARAYDAFKADAWPHLLVAGKAYLSSADLVTVVGGMRRNDGPAGIPEDSPTDLGTPLPDDEWPEDDGPADQDPGGIR